MIDRTLSLEQWWHRGVRHSARGGPITVQLSADGGRNVPKRSPRAGTLSVCRVVRLGAIFQTTSPTFYFNTIASSTSRHLRPRSLLPARFDREDSPAARANSVDAGRCRAATRPKNCPVVLLTTSRLGDVVPTYVRYPLPGPLPAPITHNYYTSHALMPLASTSPS